MTGNWGRWGADDERGAPNLIDQAAVLAAAATISRGISISLAQPLSGSTAPSRGRSGLVHHMLRDGGDYAIGGRLLGRSRFAEDYIGLSTHLGTHIDGLAHLWYDVDLYNGHPEASVRSSGASRCGVDKIGPLIGRGMLLDPVAQLGPRELASGAAIDRDLLIACCEAAGGEPRAGDVVLIRTGWAETAGEGYFSGEPGLDLSAAAWLAERDVAVVGSDNYAIEVLTEERAVDGFPVHELLIRDCGIPLIENLDLEELAEQRQGPFLFAACPLPLRGATASPLAPVAVL